MIKLFLVVLALLAPNIVNAATTNYNCKFSVEASPKGVKKEKLELQYVLDAKTKKAYLIGNAGSAEVKFIENTGGISFVEITESGNVMVTTITKSGESVHSRNGIMFEELVPSQYYGTCIKQ